MFIKYLIVQLNDIITLYDDGKSLSPNIRTVCDVIQYTGNSLILTDKKTFADIV